MSSRSLNKVMLIGNLTRDPNLRYTGTGTAVCSFGLATNRSWQGDDGELQERVDFQNIVAWSKLADICGQLLHKGDKVYVEGRLQNREWQDDQDQKRTIAEVVIDNMILLRSSSNRGDSSSYGSDDTSGNSSSSKSSAKPKKKAAPKKASNTGSDDTMDTQDIADDIPF